MSAKTQAKQLEEPFPFPVLEAEATLGEMWPHIQAMMNGVGSDVAIMVTGATVAKLKMTIAGRSQEQSLPPGDILVLVLPPAQREAKVALIMAA